MPPLLSSPKTSARKYVLDDTLEAVSKTIQLEPESQDNRVDKQKPSFRVRP